MGRGGEQSLFFLSLPDLRKLCGVTVSLHRDESEARNRQMKTCRELVLLYADLLACPALDSFTDVMLVMGIPFFKKGIIQAYTQRHNLQMGPPQRVLPGILQACVSYTLTTRLAPTWNRAGLYLISGKDFLTHTGKLNAVGMELTTSESQLCISVEASTVRLPQARGNPYGAELEDFDIPPMVLKNFYSRPDSVIHTYTMGGSNWCYILPSMKRGQVISISRQLPPDSPFSSYADLQNHWSSLYGYRLPELAEEEQVYCGIYFKLVGERLFTYPLSCIRALPVQRCPRVDLQGALGSFISDVRDRLQSVCGFPVRMTSRPCYHTTGLARTGSEQMLSGKPVNLTTKSSSRPVLTQLPALAPPPTKPSFGSQLPAGPPPSHQPGAQSYGGGRERQEGSQDSAFVSGRSEMQSQGGGGESEWSSSTSSHTESSSFSSSSSSLSSSLGYQSAPSLSSSSSLSSSFSSSFCSSPIPSAQPLAPKLVPIFKNKSLMRHVNVTQLLHQKQKEQRRGGGGGEERGRVTLVPALGQKRPAPASLFSMSNPSIPSSSSAPSSLFSSSSSSNSRPAPRWPQSTQLRPPSVPRFTQHPKPHGFASHLPSRAHSNLNLSHGLNPSPSFSQGGAFTSRSEVGVGRGARPPAAPQPAPPPSPPQPPRPLTPIDIPSNRGGSVFESNRKRSKPTIQDVNVETMALNNQLSKVNAATLLAWLKGRGVAVRAKDRKEELVLKVMACLGRESEP